MNINITCPHCQSQIYVDPAELIKGRQFCCSGCAVSVSLAVESQSIVKQSMQKLESMQQPG